MDFDITDEQTMLRDTVRDLLASNYTAESRLQVADTELGWSPQVWRQLAELGVLGLSFAEEDGGMGAGGVETMLVQQELGRHLAPEPLLDSVLLPGTLVARAGTPGQRQRILPEVSAGTKLLAFAHNEPGIRWPLSELGTRAVGQAGDYVLAGVKNPVPHGDCADEFVVSAVLPDGDLGLFLVAADAQGVDRTSYATMDSRRGAQVEFDAAPAELLGIGGDARAVVDSVLAYADASLCAEAVGAMEQALRFTTDYLKTRKQFGVTLSKFQTLTQRAADMYVSLELAQSMSYYVTAALADNPDNLLPASRARLHIGRAARHIGQEAIQLHGGIGMTAEYPVGHYTARLTALAHTHGSDAEHLQVLSSHIKDYALPEL